MRRTSNEQKVLDHISMEPMSGCWIWTGALSRDGYSFVRYWLKGYSVVGSAHRLAYELFRGPIPEDRELDHLCRVRCCVNPWHREIVTDQVNALRGLGMGGRNARKTHCIRGHELSPENLFATKCRRERRCKLCAKGL